MKTFNYRVISMIVEYEVSYVTEIFTNIELKILTRVEIIIGQG